MRALVAEDDLIGADDREVLQVRIALSSVDRNVAL
jgi:hypothetical protein